MTEAQGRIDLLQTRIRELELEVAKLATMVETLAVSHAGVLERMGPKVHTMEIEVTQ